MKKIRIIARNLLCVMLLFLLCGCGSNKVEKATEQCEIFMKALEQGNWETIQGNMPLDGLNSRMPEKEQQNGVMQEIMKSMTYKIESVKEQENGTIIVDMFIETTDLKALLESLPEDISSQEEAGIKMKELVATTPRKKFSAKVSMVYVEETEDFEIEIDVSFANAVTGGMYDLLVELMGGVE